MDPDNETTTITTLIEPWRDQGNALITVLQRVQDQLGYISDIAVPIVANS
jgi:NADH:ubiquinone oxidoreductase subunit E